MDLFDYMTCTLMGNVDVGYNVSGEKMQRDTPSGLFEIDIIQEHMKGEYTIYLNQNSGEGGEKRRERRVFIATNPFLL